jgi:UDP-glucose 4-epimerase
VSRRAEGPPAARRHWRVDLADATAVTDLIRAVRPEYVFHLASHVMGAPDIKHVLPTFHGNLQTSVNLMCALVEAPCTRMITTGSLVEPDPGVEQKIPNSPYAAAKWACSDYARMFHALYGLPIAIARVFMVYGPGQQDETKLVPYSIRCLLRGEAPKITAGKHLIDWVFLGDVVDGLLRLAVAPAVDGKTVDLGSGSVVSTASVVDTICDLMGGRVRPEYGALPERPLEPKRVARVDETRRMIGWVPTVGMTQGLQKTIDSYRPQGGE